MQRSHRLGRQPFVLVALLSSPLAVSGCGQQTPDSAGLHLDGPAQLTARAAERREVEVRLLGAPDTGEVGQTLAFELDGQVLGASLEQQTAVTDAQGYARVVLVAGQPGAFSLQITADNAEPLRIIVSVEPPQLVVQASYTTADWHCNGAVPAELRVWAVEAGMCTALEPNGLPQGAPSASTPLGEDFAWAPVQLAIDGLDPAKTYALVARGVSSDRVIAGGCIESVALPRHEARDQKRGGPVPLDVAQIVTTQARSCGLKLTTTLQSGRVFGTTTALLGRVAADPLGAILESLLRDPLLSPVKTQLLAYLRSVIPGIDVFAAKLKQLLAHLQQLQQQGQLQLESRLLFGLTATPQSMPASQAHQLAATHALEALLATTDGVITRYAIADTTDDKGTNQVGAAVGMSIHGSHVTLERHEIAIPLRVVLADIVQQHLGDWRTALSHAVDCRQLAEAIAKWAEETFSDALPGSSGLLALGRTSAELACTNGVSQLETALGDAVGSDVGAFRRIFAGQAQAVMSPRRQLRGLTNGRWQNLGTFDATADLAE